MTDHLRTRLLVAAERFANEIADAIEEASGEKDRVREESKPKVARKRGLRAAPAESVSESALAKADEILERSGFGRRTGS